MKRRFLSRFTGALLAMAGLTAPALAEPDAVKLFAEHCAACHGTDRLGGQGPALLPENLGRLMGPRAASVIADGRAATQMPGFGAKLNKDEIAALAGLYFDASRFDTFVGQRRDHSQPGHPRRRAGARQAALRRRSVEPVCRRRDRRPPRDDPRW